MSTSFFLNKTSNKYEYDVISIAKDNEFFNVRVYDDNHLTKSFNTPTTTLKLSKDALMEYMQCVLQLLQKDEDSKPYASVDVGIMGFPNICMKVKNLDIPLIVRCMNIWA